jgi:pre-rRNA-processing protein TSR4
VRKPAGRKKVTKSVASQEPANPSQGLGTTLFGGSGPAENSGIANPFSTSKQNSDQETNPFASLPPTSSLAAMPPQKPEDPVQPPIATFADKMKISDATETPSLKQPDDPWPDQKAFPPPFPRYYLDADGEELEIEKPAPSASGPSKTQYDADDSTANAAGKDFFESDLDKTFQKFSDRIAQNPEQVLRYEFNGQPLLYSGTDDVATRFIVPHRKAGAARGMPRCEKCGAQRVFELQLVPGLIYKLEKDETMDFDDGMDWGTIIVGTCANNCGDPGAFSFREEWVGVQWEERVLKRS